MGIQKKFLKPFLLMICLTLVLAYQSLVNAQSPLQTVVASLRSELHPLQLISPGQGFQDLIPLGQAIEGTKLVGLGEATHGTHEFFALKSRVFKYLVAEKNFSVLALEANLSEAEAIDRYIKGSSENPEALLNNTGFWIWRTQEMVELLNWMRSYNRTHNNELSFSGFDVQSAGLAASEVVNYLCGRLAPGQLSQVQKIYEKVIGLDRLVQGDKVNVEAVETTARQLVTQNMTVLKIFEHNKRTWMTQNASDYLKYRQRAELVAQSVKLRALPPGQAYAQREQAMAQQIGWLQERFVNQKMVLWGHNTHVIFNDEKGVRSMGGWLRQAFNPNYYAMGFAFGDGKIRAHRVSQDGRKMIERAETATHDIPPSRGAETALVATGQPQFFINLKTLSREHPILNWLTQRPIRNFGAVVAEQMDLESGRGLWLGGRADGLIFISKSQPSWVLARTEISEIQLQNCQTSKLSKVSRGLLK
jgi:erythromycin esterase